MRIYRISGLYPWDSGYLQVPGMKTSINNGITHLIEHLIFKGTHTRSFRDIAIEFDAMGAEFNAFTDKEYCCIYADFIDENLPQMPGASS